MTWREEWGEKLVERRKKRKIVNAKKKNHNEFLEWSSQGKRLEEKNEEKYEEEDKERKKTVKTKEKNYYKWSIESFTWNRVESI